MNREIKDYQRFGEVQEKPGVLTLKNLFDTENSEVTFSIESEGDIILHLWVESSSGQKLDLTSFLPSRERIVIKKSSITRFSAAIDDSNKAILEWNHTKGEYKTEDILSFIHELGHAMDGVQVSFEIFSLRARYAKPSTEEERDAYLKDEYKAQDNALRILKLLIRRKIFKDTEELQSLIVGWDADYRERARNSIEKKLRNNQ